MKLMSVALSLTCLTIASCSGGDTGPRITGETEPPSCSGRRATMARWLPEDLPLPKGTFTFKNLERSAGYYRALLVVPLDLPELADFLLDRWPKAGYSLGPGDTERDREIEDTFEKPPASGIFIAYNHCDPGTTVVNLIYRKRGSVPLPPIGNLGDPLFPDELRKASPQD